MCANHLRAQIATLAHMATVASRDLRNHTSEVLGQVAQGVEITVTVHGRPVALLIPPRASRPQTLRKADLLAFLEQSPPDADFSTDLAWISAGTTDDLDNLA